MVPSRRHGYGPVSRREGNGDWRGAGDPAVVTKLPTAIQTPAYDSSGPGDRARM